MLQSLDEAFMMVPLAQAYDLIYDRNVLSVEDKQHIEYDLFWESAQGLSKLGIRGNWGRGNRLHLHSLFEWLPLSRSFLFRKINCSAEFHRGP